MVFSSFKFHSVLELKTDKSNTEIIDMFFLKEVGWTEFPWTVKVGSWDFTQVYGPCEITRSSPDSLVKLITHLLTKTYQYCQC